jgi:hypothetical protein
LAREGSSSPFDGPELAISVSPCAGRLKEWYYEHWAAAPGMRELKVF